jgi:hypothetical protein
MGRSDFGLEMRVSLRGKSRNSRWNRWINTRPVTPKVAGSSPVAPAIPQHHSSVAARRNSLSSWPCGTRLLDTYDGWRSPASRAIRSSVGNRAALQIEHGIDERDVLRLGIAARDTSLVGPASVSAMTSMARQRRSNRDRFRVRDFAGDRTFRPCGREGSGGSASRISRAALLDRAAAPAFL